MREVVGTPGYYTLSAFVYGICQIPRVLQKGRKLVLEMTNSVEVFNLNCKTGVQFTEWRSLDCVL